MIHLSGSDVCSDEVIQPSGLLTLRAIDLEGFCFGGLFGSVRRFGSSLPRYQTHTYTYKYLSAYCVPAFSLHG